MKTLLAVCGGISLALALSQAARPEGWRGVVPLHSTRADVVRLLGKPDPVSGRYELEGEAVVILYVTGTCSGGESWDVPGDTVLSVSVFPRGKPKLSGLRINLNEFEKYEGAGSTSYINKREGVAYHVAEPGGEVTNIHYEPSAADERLRCPPIWTPSPSCKTAHDPCPYADIDDHGTACSDSRHRLDVSLSGLAPDDTLTFSWAVSAGAIAGGQGTSSVTVDTTAARGKPVVVRLNVVIKECEACNIEQSYTIEPCPESRPAKGGRRKP